MALIKCKECGKEISDQAECCPNCGIKINPQNKKRSNIIIIIIVLIIIVVGGFIINDLNFKLNKQKAINEYNKARSITSNNYSTNYSNNTTSTSKTDLKLSKITLDFNRNTNIKASGTITNNGKTNVKFVTVKISFSDSKGNVIDTDSTYAVGSEGIKPRRKFKIYLLC